MGDRPVGRAILPAARFELASLRDFQVLETFLRDTDKLGKWIELASGVLSVPIRERFRTCPIRSELRTLWRGRRRHYSGYTSSCFSESFKLADAARSIRTRRIGHSCGTEGKCMNGTLAPQANKGSRQQRPQTPNAIKMASAQNSPAVSVPLRLFAI